MTKSGASNVRDKKKKKSVCVCMATVDSDKIDVFVFASLLFFRNEQRGAAVDTIFRPTRRINKRNF